MLLVHLFAYFALVNFVLCLFLLVSGVVSGLLLWQSLDFYANFCIFGFGLCSIRKMELVSVMVVCSSVCFFFFFFFFFFSRFTTPRL